VQALAVLWSKGIEVDQLGNAIGNAIRHAGDDATPYEWPHSTTCDSSSH
jgi:hypothetical protein